MKTLKYSFLFILLLSYSSLFSQHLEPVWVKHYGAQAHDGFGDDFIQVDSEGNILIAGFLKEGFVDTFLVNGFFVAKYSPSGNVIWLAYPDTSSGFFPRFFKLNSINEMYVFSYANGYPYLKNKLLKLNNLGEKQWGKEFTTVVPDYGFGLSQIVTLEIDKSNQLFLATNLYSFIVLPNNDTIRQDTFVQRKYFIFQFNSEGDFIDYFRPFGRTDLENFRFDAFNNCIHLTTKPYGGTRFIKYDTSYNYMLNIKDYNYVFDKFSVSDDNSLYTTLPISGTAFDIVDTGAVTQNLYALKLNNSFEIEWARKFKGYKECPNPVIPQVNMCNTYFMNINTTSHDDNIYISGLFKYKFSIDNNIFYTTDSSKLSFFITKFDKDGNYQWTEVFQSKETLSNNGYNTIEVKVLPDGSLLCGLMYETEVQIGDSLYPCNGNTDFILMRLQETGTGLKPVQQNKSFSFELYPNPANDVVNIAINTDESSHSCTLKVFNIQGALVYEKPVSLQKGNNNIRFSVSHLSQGMYFVSLDMVTEKVVRKLVKY